MHISAKAGVPIAVTEAAVAVEQMTDSMKMFRWGDGRVDLRQGELESRRNGFTKEPELRCVRMASSGNSRVC